MVMAKLHMICGNCGQNDMFKFKIDHKGRCNNEGNEYPGVSISCENCSTIHSLEDNAEESIRADIYTRRDVITNIKAFHLDSVNGKYSKTLLEFCNNWIKKNL